MLFTKEFRYIFFILLVSLLAIFFSLFLINYVQYNVILQDQTTENVADSFVSESAETKNYGSQDVLQVHYTTSTGYQKNAIFQFNLSQIPNRSTIDSAYLQVLIDSNGLDSGEAVNWGLYRVYSNYSWTEDSINWNNKPNATTNYNATAASTTNIATGKTGWIIMDATGAVREAWNAGERVSTIYVVPAAGSGSPGTTDYVGVCSKEHATVANRPILNVTYSINTSATVTSPTTAVPANVTSNKNFTICYQAWDGSTEITTNGVKYLNHPDPLGATLSTFTVGGVAGSLLWTPLALQTSTQTETFASTGNWGTYTESLGTGWAVEAKSTAISQDGSYVAHADDCNSDCIIELTNAVDSRNFTSGSVIFNWGITGLDSGEYLSLDVYSNGQWTNSVWQVSNEVGTGAATGQNVNVSSYLGYSDFKIRWRAKMSATSEYAEVDLVNITLSGNPRRLQQYYNGSCYVVNVTAPSDFTYGTKDLFLNISVDNQIFDVTNATVTNGVNYGPDVYPPKITVVSPTNTLYPGGIVLFNITLDEPASLCKLTYDNWVTNYTMSNVSLLNYNLTRATNLDGNYTVKFWCNDTSGNVNNTVTQNFSSEYINITVCRNLTDANVVHYLQSNLNMSTLDRCLEIQANNITVNGNGRKISYQDDGVGMPVIAVLTKANYTTIKNLILNYTSDSYCGGTGITNWYSNQHDYVIDNVTLYGWDCSAAGIGFEGENQTITNVNINGFDQFPSYVAFSSTTGTVWENITYSGSCGFACMMTFDNTSNAVFKNFRHTNVTFNNDFLFFYMYNYENITMYDSNFGNGRVVLDVADVVGNVTFINVTYGSEVVDPSLTGAGLIVQSRINVQAKNKTGSGVASAPLVVKDSSGTIVATGTSDSNGWVNGLIITHHTNLANVTSNKTPHNFTFTATGIYANSTNTTSIPSNFGNVYVTMYPPPVSYNSSVSNGVTISNVNTRTAADKRRPTQSFSASMVVARIDQLWKRLTQSITGNNIVKRIEVMKRGVTQSFSTSAVVSRAKGIFVRLTQTFSVSSIVVRLISVFRISNQNIEFGSYTPSLSGAIAYYSFNAGIGATLTDDSGNGHTGTINGADWSDGIRFGGMWFNGSGDYVELSNINEFQTGSMSISAWYYLSSDLDNNELDMIFRTGNASSDNDLEFFVGDDAGTEFYRLGVYNGTGWNQATYIADVVPGAWYHMVGVFNNTNGAQMRLYLNGVEVANFTFRGQRGTSFLNNHALLGAGNDGGGTHYFMHGYLDEVVIYNRPITAAEVTSLYNAQYSLVTSKMYIGKRNLFTNFSVNATINKKYIGDRDSYQEIIAGEYDTVLDGLITWWTLDSNVTNEPDSSPSKKAITRYNDPTFEENGVIEGQYSCDGLDDYFEVANDPIYNFSKYNNTGFTILAWYTPLKSSYSGSGTIQAETTSGNTVGATNVTEGSTTYRMANSATEGPGYIVNYTFANTYYGNGYLFVYGGYNQSSATAACNYIVTDDVDGTVLRSGNCRNKIYNVTTTTMFEGLTNFRGNNFTLLIYFKDIGVNVYVDRFQMTAGRDAIVEKQATWGLWLSDGQLRPFVVNGSGTRFDGPMTQLPTPQVPNFVGSIYDGSTHKLYSMLNGVISPTSTTVVGDPREMNNVVRLCRSANWNTYAWAKIDEVRIYNRSLSSAEILQIYNERSNDRTFGLTDQYAGIRNPNQNFSIDDSLTRLLKLLRGPTDSVEFGTAISRLRGVFVNPLQEILFFFMTEGTYQQGTLYYTANPNLQIFVDMLNSRTLGSGIQVTNQIAINSYTDLLNVYLRMVLGNFQMTGLTNRIQFLWIKLSQGTTINMVGKNIFGTVVLPSQVVNIDMFTDDIAGLLRKPTNSISTNTFVGRFVAMFIKSTNGFTISNLVDNIANLFLNTNQIINVDGSVSRVGVFGRIGSNSFTISSALQRSTFIFRLPGQSFNINDMISGLLSAIRGVDNTVTVDIVTGKSANYPKNLFDQLTIDSSVSRTFFAMRFLADKIEIGLEQIYLYDKYALEYFVNVVNSLNFDSLINRLIDALRTSNQQVDVGFSLNRILFGVRSISQNVTVGDSVDYWTNTYVGIFDSASIDNLVTTLLDLIRTNGQGITFDNFVARLFSGQKGILEDINFNFLVKLLNQFFRDTTPQALDITVYQDEYGHIIRVVTSAGTFDDSVNRLGNFGKKVYNAFSIKQVSGRVTYLGKNIVDSFSFDSVAGRLREVKVTVSDFFNINSLGQRAGASFKRLINQIVDFFEGGLARLRYWTEEDHPFGPDTSGEPKPGTGGKETGGGTEEGGKTPFSDFMNKKHILLILLFAVIILFVATLLVYLIRNNPQSFARRYGTIIMIILGIALVLAILFTVLVYFYW